MNFLNRSFASIVRNPGKAILLLLIIFILGCVISGAISVSQAIQNTDSNIRAAFPPIVTVEMDHRAFNDYIDAGGQWSEDMEEFTHDTLLEIAKLPQVESYDFSIMAGLLSSELEMYIPEGSHEAPFTMGDYDSFSINGVQNIEPIDVSEGIIEISQGRLFNQTELDNFTAVAIISENFARLNNLGVGSTMSLTNVSWDTREVRDIGWDDSFYTEENIYERRAYDLEVVGIFTPLIEMNTGDQWADDWLTVEKGNRIYVPNAFAREVHIWQMEREMELFPDEEWFEGKTPEDLIWYQNVFKLHDSSDIPEFRAAVEAITPEFYTVIDAGSESMDFGASLDSLNSLANVILIIAVSAAVLILSLLITLFIRERRREIGIYLALGEKRVSVVVQMVAEVLVIALIAISLSLFAGNLLSANISETMLRNDLTAAQNVNEGMGWGGTLDRLGLRADLAVEEVMVGYSVSLDLPTVAIFFAIGIGVVIISTIIPMLYILRLNPRKIMM